MQRVRVLTALAVLVASVLLCPDVTAWPAPRYECYCADCYSRWFVCRNRDFTCNCAACSCYIDVTADTQTPTLRHRNGNSNSS